MNNQTPQQQLDAFLDKFTADIAASARASLRHIVLTSPADIASPDIDALIAHALKSAKVAIDPQRKRRLLIKSVSAKQRPRRPPK